MFLVYDENVIVFLPSHTTNKQRVFKLRTTSTILGPETDSVSKPSTTRFLSQEVRVEPRPHVSVRSTLTGPQLTLTGSYNGREDGGNWITPTVHGVVPREDQTQVKRVSARDEERKDIQDLGNNDGNTTNSSSRSGTKTRTTSTCCPCLRDPKP